MEKRKITGIITSKEWQELSNNFKLKVITSDKQEFFFYSQQKHQEKSQEISVGEKYLFCLFKGKKYWFLESWEKAEEIKQETPEWLNKWKAELSEFNLKKLQEQTRKKSENLEKWISCLKEQMINNSSEEEVFLEYLEQFINLLLIKHLSIKNKHKSHLTEKEKKEQAILNKIVVNWFYKT
jgi:hypothetical protein